jgi:hypothetical protein
VSGELTSGSKSPCRQKQYVPTKRSYLPTRLHGIMNIWTQTLGSQRRHVASMRVVPFSRPQNNAGNVTGSGNNGGTILENLEFQTGGPPPPPKCECGCRFVQLGGVGSERSEGQMLWCQRGRHVVYLFPLRI